MKTLSIPKRFILAIAGPSLAMLAAFPASGQQPPSLPSPVQKASFDRSAPRETQQAVCFSKRPARIGDEVEQAISLEMRLATSVRRGSQLREKNHAAVRAEQRRVVTTTAVEAGRTTAVRVHYLEATKEISSTDGAEPAQASDETSAIPQPIAGKTYLCRRDAGNDGKLIITDENGNIPPMEEFEIVAQHMEIVGRPNPLAEFLADKSVAIGQTIELPREIAGKLFNLGDQFGDVTRFELTLEKAHIEGGATQAVFLARVEAASNGSSQMRMQVEGPLVVQADTCRAAHVDLSGPIGMSETRGSYSTAYQVIGTGQLKMRIASAYRDRKR